MTDEFKPDLGRADETYAYIAHQIEREDNLYQRRLTTCVAVNLGLAAAAAAQVSGDINRKTYMIVVGCCVVGFLLTEGIRFSIEAGKTQTAYLWKCFGELNDRCNGRFPFPFYHDPEGVGIVVPARFTAIPLVFEALWIAAFAIVTFIFFCPL